MIGSYMQNMLMLRVSRDSAKRFSVSIGSRPFLFFRELSQLDTWSPKGANCREILVWKRKKNLLHFYANMPSLNEFIGNVNLTVCIEICSQDSQDTNQKTVWGVVPAATKKIWFVRFQGVSLQNAVDKVFGGYFTDRDWRITDQSWPLTPIFNLASNRSNRTTNHNLRSISRKLKQ